MPSFGDNDPAARLPPPPPQAQAHSARLVERIAARIDADGGVIGFDEFMRMALYEPGLGYYSGAAPKFGADGDFVTAPEISELFGFCLAQQCEALVTQGCVPAILEFGAGSGRLCAQLLRAMPQLERYFILDLSADLRRRQHQFLRQALDADLFHKIEWLDRLPCDFDGIVLANEVLDAMPVRLLRKDEAWMELGVGYDGTNLDWHVRAADGEALATMLEIEARHGELPAGYATELNLNYAPWLAALAAACREAVVLIIDYGYEQSQYYHPGRGRGTLNCHYRHRVHDAPLLFPGLQDITAFVDFDACADAAEAQGFRVSGLARQGAFLVANGLLDEAQRRAEGAEPIAQMALSQQVATLTLPQEMGEKFKVLALQKNLALELPALRGGGPFG